MQLTREEVNVRQLLKRCEDLAKEQSLEDNWRLKKYVESLGQMLVELKSQSNKTAKEAMSERLADYTKRVAFLTGLVQTSALSDPIEKLEAVQLLPHGASTACVDSPSQEIHQKTVSKYGMELRSELFGLDNEEDSLRRRNMMRSDKLTGAEGEAELDSLLKYQQSVQERVAENMLTLTTSLKEQSLTASIILRKDTETLKKSSDLTDRNVSSLSVESSKLQEHSRSACKCWLWVMLAVVIVIFINMVLFMKVMKKKKF